VKHSGENSSFPVRVLMERGPEGVGSQNFVYPARSQEKGVGGEQQEKGPGHSGGKSRGEGKLVKVIRQEVRDDHI